MGPSDSFRCKKCGAENRSDRLFCAGCGAYLGSHEGQVDRFRPPAPTLHRGAMSQPLKSKGRRQSPVLGVALLLLFLGACAAVFFFVQDQIEAVRTTATTGRVATTSTTTSPDQGAGASTSTTGSTTSTTQARLIPSQAKASSTLEATEEYSYAVGNLSDGDLSTVWSEGAEGEGEGQWLLFTFNQPVALEQIDVANGYQRDQQRFYGNARVRTMRIDFSSGQSQEIQLFDDMGYQQVIPALESGQTVTSVKMTILSVYSGDEWEDLGLSEVKFVGSR